jgi:radical SAM superfamily enzyme YgiQ (UPF0313 family)
MELDVLFCVTPGTAIWRLFPYIEPTYGPSLVVGGLRQSGFSVDYYDLNLQLNSWQKNGLLLSPQTISILENWEENSQAKNALPSDLKQLLDRFWELLSKKSFRYVAFSLDRVTTKVKVFNAEYGFAIALANRIKEERQCPVIFGGQVMQKIGFDKISSSLKLYKNHCADFFFGGDGAIALPLLLRDLDEKNTLLIGLASHLKSSGEKVMHWRKDSSLIDLSKSIVGTTRKSLAKSGPIQKYNIEHKLLDITPSFQVLGKEFYSVRFADVYPKIKFDEWTNRPLTILPYKFAYGCSHRCAFCKAAGEHLIYKPVEKVVDDLARSVEENEVDAFRFFNSQINFDNHYVHKLCNEIIRRRLKIYFSDSAGLRHLDYETISMLREAGCVKLWFGLESPVDRILKLINKQLTLPEAEEGIQNANRAGIWIALNLILGFPHESDEEFNAVCNFIRSHVEIVNCWGFSAMELFPKTPMYENPEKHGIIIEHKYTDDRRMCGYAFSEVGGLPWEERLARAVKREETCFTLINPTVHRFYSNDYLVFSLYREYGSKDLVKKNLDRYIQAIRSKMKLSEASKWISSKKVIDFDSNHFLSSESQQSLSR